MTEKALRQRFVGQKHVPIEGIVQTALPTHARGRGKTLLEDQMIPQNEAGWAYYSSNGSVHITDPDKAVSFIEEHNGNVPWNYQN